MFVVDEAPGVPDIIFEVGAGSLSTPGAKIIMAGNPTRLSGYFYDVFHPKPGTRKWWTKKVQQLSGWAQLFLVPGSYYSNIQRI